MELPPQRRATRGGVAAQLRPRGTALPVRPGHRCARQSRTPPPPSPPRVPRWRCSALGWLPLAPAPGGCPLSPSPRWRPRAAAARREAAAQSEAAAAPPHPAAAARHRRAGRPCRRWAAPPPGARSGLLQGRSRGLGVRPEPARVRGRAGGRGASEPASNGGGGRGAGGGVARALRVVARMRGAGPRGAPGGAGRRDRPVPVPVPVSAEGPAPRFVPSAALGTAGGTRPPLQVAGSAGGKRGEGARPEPPPLRLHPRRCVGSGVCGLPPGSGVRRGCRRAALGHGPAGVCVKEGETRRERASALDLCDWC